MNKEDVVYIYTTEYYSDIKNEIMQSTATWMGREIIILIEASQKDKYYMISLICAI